MPKVDPRKRKRVVLTLQQKMDICIKLEKGFNRQDIMNEYGVGSSTIYDIRKQSPQLKEFFIKTENAKGMQNRRTLRSAKVDDLDRAVYQWFQQMRSEGATLSGPLVREKAREFHEKMNIDEPCAFSQGWLSRFKIRHGIRKIDVSGEQKSADKLSADGYAQEFSHLLEEHGLSPDLIFNADETGLLWRCMPRTTLASGDEKVAHGFKQNKDRITVLCCANATGTCQISLTVIGKFAKPRALTGISNLPVHYTHQSNAWMTAEIFEYWFMHIFVPAVNNFLKKKGLPEDSKVCLLLDNCRAHPPADQLVSGNIRVTLKFEFSIFYWDGRPNCEVPTRSNVCKIFFKNINI